MFTLGETDGVQVAPFFPIWDVFPSRSPFMLPARLESVGSSLLCFSFFTWSRGRSFNQHLPATLAHSAAAPFHLFQVRRSVGT